MSLYSIAKSFRIPESKAKCAYCHAEYMCVEGAYSICPSCESMVVPGAEAGVDGIVAEKMGSISASMARGAFLEAAEGADALATSQDPKILYALASFFKLLSDITYADVDYTMKAFMERNADNRNDEPKRNRYSAMHLESRDRECLHKCIQLLELSGASDANSLFIKAMAEIKLRRYAHASIIIGNWSYSEPACRYAGMALATRTRERSAEKKIIAVLKDREMGALFYASEYFALRREFERAEKLISMLSSHLNLSKYGMYKKRMESVANAAGI